MKYLKITLLTIITLPVSIIYWFAYMMIECFLEEEEKNPLNIF